MIGYIVECKSNCPKKKTGALFHSHADFHCQSFALWRSTTTPATTATTTSTSVASVFLSIASVFLSIASILSSVAFSITSIFLSIASILSPFAFSITSIFLSIASILSPFAFSITSIFLSFAFSITSIFLSMAATCTVTASLYVLMEIEETATTPAEKRLYSCEESGGANPCLGDCWGGCGPKKVAPSAMLIKSIHFPNDAQRRAIAGQTKMFEAKRTGINLISMVWKLELHMLGVQKCLYETNTRAAAAATTTTTTTRSS